MENELEVGRLYESRAGEKVRIISREYGVRWPLLGDNGLTYECYGAYINPGHASQADLIRLCYEQSEAEDYEPADTLPEVISRKDHPVYSGVLVYFPDALMCVSRVSAVGNDQHNPGQPLHWDRSKSGDEYDACARHLINRAAGEEFDDDGVPHMAKVAWRALAALQKEIEVNSGPVDGVPR